MTPSSLPTTAAAKRTASETGGAHLRTGVRRSSQRSHTRHARERSVVFEIRGLYPLGCDLDIAIVDEIRRDRRKMTVGSAGAKPQIGFGNGQFPAFVTVSDVQSGSLRHYWIEVADAALASRRAASANASIRQQYGNAANGLFSSSRDGNACVDGVLDLALHDQSLASA